MKSNFACCIGDLGLAVKQKDDTGVDMVPTNKLSGTRRYLPPEVLDQSMNFEKFQCYTSADVYSASLVIWEIFQCVSTDQGQQEKNSSYSHKCIYFFLTFFYRFGCTGLSSCYKPPFYEHVPHLPSLESMKKVVVTKGLRPSLKIFQCSEVILLCMFYCMA